MSAHLDERYFDWLYSQVCSVETQRPSKSYRNLLDILYTKEFVWLVPNDDNRVEDGKDLRYEFFESEGITIKTRDTHWLSLGCSMLEMLVALSRRISFEAGDEPRVWFWHMLTNIELDHLNDRKRISNEDVEGVLDRVIWRTYNYNGGGGLFPLRYPEEDQRKVELWYQISSYIFEHNLV